MIDVTHPVYLWFGLSLFFICIASMFAVIDKMRKQQGSVPILFSVHQQELHKLHGFVAMLPNKQRRIVRSIALAGFFFLAAGLWFGVKGL